MTDAEGVAAVELPATLYILRLWASKKPFVAMFANWENNDTAGGSGLPAEYVFRLETAVAAGGRIVDEQGRPIQGVRVQVSLTSGLQPVGGDGRVKYDSSLAAGIYAVRTDSDGRWRVKNVPNHPQAQLNLMISHPDYVSDQQWGQIAKGGGVTIEMLRQETATLTLKRGVTVSGRLTDPGGQPIPKAIVVLGDDPYMSWMTKKFPTDADGRYRLPALRPATRR